MEETQTPPIPAAPAPPPEPLPFFQYLRATSDSTLAGYHQGMYEDWIVTIPHLGPNHFLINDPAGIKRVLIDNAKNYVKGEMEQRVSAMGMEDSVLEIADESWRTRRSTMTPLFDYRSLPQYAPIITEACQRMLTAWQGLPHGESVEISATMLRLTSQVIAQILFASEYEGIAEAMQSISHRYRSEPMIDLIDFIPVLNRLRRLYRRRQGRRMFNHMASAIDQVVAARSRGGKEGDGAKVDSLFTLHDPKTGNPMTPEELRSYVITIFTAGHETVAQTLAWTLYLLSQHPEQEAKLHREVDTILAGRTPDFTDLEKLPYTRMIIEEALRLYPPFHMLAWREALADDEVCGQLIPKGATISVVPWILHRHRKLWDDPGHFDPERFHPSRAASRPRLAYLPFGVGPRVCIGASFAMTQATMILATVAQHYRLRLVPGHKVEPQGRLILRAKYGLPMVPEPR
jgi:cytochrome P450